MSRRRRRHAALIGHRDQAQQRAGTALIDHAREQPRPKAQPLATVRAQLIAAGMIVPAGSDPEAGR